ncbi:HTH-type transcriptional regulator MalT [Paraconexibacter sp. AEG42_29]|uniref:HTH-type transcriptional regulator MalT n=1 Tax=Paraconexibacter sp. AEG42_29 TaxID=2997339 RepID=A0AAU7AQY3_9ACTN
MEKFDDEPGGNWIEGFALDDPTLADSILGLWQAAARVASAADDEQPTPRDLRTATALLQEASEWVVTALEGGDRTSTPRMLVEISQAQGAVREYGNRARTQALARVHSGLGRLRGLGTVEELMELGPTELCRCGFDRAMISRIDGSHVIPQVMHIPEDPDWAYDLQQVISGLRIELGPAVAETDMLRRPGPMLMAHALDDDRMAASMLEATETRSYVAAPIMPEGTVIGFLHADCLLSRRTLDEFDRDLIGTFAQGFSSAWERAVLIERLRTLRQDVRRVHSSVLAVMDDFSEAAVEIELHDPGDQSVVSSAAALPVSGAIRLERLLTRRELDVMHLMAAGETNAQIASALVVSEGTVKSHVKHILRKLRAKNRAEAVSRFVTLSRRDNAA